MNLLVAEQAVLKEVTESEGQVVMFIDEIHTVVGAGATSGSMDASNLLKPMLARGELRCIGATTLNEYKQVRCHGPWFTSCLLRWDIYGGCALCWWI